MNKKNSKDCVHCHICRDKCDFLTKYNIDIGDIEKLKELSMHCFLCGKCTAVCPLDIDGRSIILNLRNERAKELGFEQISKENKATINEKLSYKFRNYKKAKKGTAFFPGCNFPSMFPKTTNKIISIFAENGISTIFDCCGKPIYELGLFDEAQKIIEDLDKRLKDYGIEEIVVACPNCKSFIEGKLNVKVTSIYKKLDELGLGKAIEGDATFYVPCPDREKLNWISDLKPFIDGDFSFVEGVQCCGLGGGASRYEKEISSGFSKKLPQDIDIFTYCASCTGNFKRNGVERVSHVLTKIMGTNENPDTKKSYVNRVLTKFK